MQVIVQDLSQRGFTASRGFPVEFSVRGPDWDRLIELSESMGDKLRESGLVVDLDTDYQVGMPELRIIPDRARAADLGVSVDEVATAINAMVGGVRVGKYNAGGRRVDVRMRLLADQRTRPEDLSRLHVRGRGGELVPLSSLVTLEERPALQAITRKDRERAISIFGNVAPGHAQDEALALRRGASRTTCRPAITSVLERELGRVPRVDRRPPLRARPRDHRRVHGPRLPVQLVPSSGDGADHPSALGRRRRVRALDRPARASTSSP